MGATSSHTKSRSEDEAKRERGLHEGTGMEAKLVVGFSRGSVVSWHWKKRLELRCVQMSGKGSRIDQGASYISKDHTHRCRIGNLLYSGREEINGKTVGHRKNAGAHGGNWWDKIGGVHERIHPSRANRSGEWKRDVNPRMYTNHLEPLIGQLLPAIITGR